MYQQNVLRARLAEENLGYKRDGSLNEFAPSNDPFITASVIQNIVRKQRRRKNITNLYLCPLATKAQTLGFTLYYLFECQEKPVSIIYPFCEYHEQGTTDGISRLWEYTIEIP